MNYTDYVNVFQGTGKYVKPKEGSLYARWNLLKGKAGNTSPAACIPFGGVACSPYSGGYPVGYGNYKLNGGREVESFFEGNKLIGFSHFTHSGVGAIGIYYNYLVTTPYVKNFAKTQGLKAFDEEEAEPGYYACRLLDEDIRCELTVKEKVAVHRYTSNRGERLKLAIDVSNNGLRQRRNILHGIAENAEIRVYDGGSAGGYVVMEGVKIYFFLTCSCEGKGGIWRKGRFLKEKSLQIRQTQDRFGIFLRTDSSRVEVKVGFSFVGEGEAKANVLETENFQRVREMAETAWNERLGRIELYGVSKEDREIFYSNYYHTLVKPCIWTKESFLWKEKEAFCFDFSTLWDVYKTQIPLLFTLYQDVGRAIVKTLLRYGKEKKSLFNALLLSTNMNVEAQQACCLGCYVLYDGYKRGLVAPTEVDDMFAVVKSAIKIYKEEVENGTIEKTTKLLDVCLIAEAFASVARTLSKTVEYEYFSALAGHWTKVFGRKGLLKTRYPYYEGNRWNYSFRFVNDVEKRIELSGGKEKLEKQLDLFFGFDTANARVDRFEGFNNETDMETPYFYHYVGAYDKLARLVNECVNACFRTGRDGLPGNNDSGGLSACYLWNFLGLFPISGQDNFFLGVPKAEKSVWRLSTGNALTIRATGTGTEIERVVFNGKRIDGYLISVKEIMQGGELVFYKKPTSYKADEL